MTLRVRDGGAEVGQAVVSLRALLTPQVYDLFEPVTVPLVRVKLESNSTHSTPIGSLTFSIAPSAYERYAPPVCFPGAVVQDFSRPYVRYYEKRIANFMRHYNVGELGRLHAYLYDTYVANGTWRNGLPEYLAQLVEKWGEEVIPHDAVPPIDSISVGGTL
ncbi:unnamed protein product [Phytomonas sp. Hart1]|nr:unnamed protein product [Phytomonas sp. Hart1]|eukprot:CCW69866.1 unnamed protein product [Phytomonas sp. isolate Hart1]